MKYLFTNLSEYYQNVLIDHAIEELLHNGLPDETLTFRYDGLFEFHHKLFNEDYWFYSNHDAYKFMSNHFDEFDVFQLIDYVKEYEESMFGEFRTPIQKDTIGNMLIYIAGEEMLFNECFITDETLIKDVIKQLKKLRHDDN